MKYKPYNENFNKGGAPVVPIIITAAVTAVIVAVIVWFVATGIQQSKYKATVGSAEERSRAIIDDALKTAESKKREVLLEAKEENLKAQNELEKEDQRTPKRIVQNGKACCQ